MTITVFGANGKVGRKVVANLLDGRHSVRAFIHSKSSIEPDPRLEFIKGDIHVPGDVELAIKGSDAVISALGSWGTKTKDIVSSGTANIIPAMKKHGISRIVSVTGAGAQDSSDKPSLIDKLSRPLLFIAAAKILRDGEDHIAQLRASGLDWSVVRSPVMRETGKIGYELSKNAPLPWVTINRNDVAKAMSELATNKDHNQSAPFISRN